jgi:hypothetical protein
MRSHASEFFLLLWLAPSVTADQIVLKNGDRVSGSIVKKDAKTLTIKTLHFGVVTTEWDQVDTISADTPLNVTLSGGKTLRGTVATTNGRLEVAAPADRESVALAEVEALRDEAEQKTYERLLEPRWTDLWNVTGSLSLAGATGNARTFTVLTPVTALRVTRHDTVNVRFGLIRGSALVNGRTETTAQAVRGGWSYNRNLRPRLFWNLFNDYEYDRFQNLDLRVVVGSGLGVNVWKGESSRFDLVAGPAWNRESFDPVRPLQPFVRNAFEGLWGDNLLLKLNERSTLTQSYRMFNNIKDIGSREEGGFRQNFDLNLTTRLTGWLTWNVTISDRFLQHPVEGRKKNDLVYATGLGFVISR